MYRREVKTPDTFGMSRRDKARVLARANGAIPAETGRHQGGPCPAVALATVAGWTYAQAEARLRREHGFNGAGLYREQVIRTFNAIFGEPAQVIDPNGMTVARVACRLPPGCNGIAFCRGHVMPIRNGRLLNAGTDHLSSVCQEVVLYNIVEEKI